MYDLLLPHITKKQMNHRNKSPKLNSSSAQSSMLIKISRNPLMKQTLITLITLITLYLLLNTFLLSPVVPDSPSFPSFPVSSTRASAASSPLPPRIFMYDLPPNFTYGVIRSYSLSRHSNSPLPPDTDLKYPGNQHSAEWYLFSHLLKAKAGSGGGGNVVRVMDPEEADLFYVPFFSSLSLVANPIRAGVDGTSNDYSDERMQEGLVDWLERSQYWKRNYGRDHVFICQDPNALYKVIDRVKNGILLVSDFGRLRGDQASLVKDVILPYSHRINPFKGDVGVENRPSLLFFMGNRYRKEGGKIRDILFQILENEEDVVMKHGAQSRESRRAATQGMHTSKFCLHPAGDTPSACRLFDAIVSLCVPVIISDQIELPFEDIIDYKKIAVFVETTSAVKPGFLVNLLRTVGDQKLLEFQQELKKVKHYFEYEDPNGTVNEIWRQVSMKLPLVKLMINRDKRLVRSELSQPDCSCLCSNRTGPITTL